MNKELHFKHELQLANTLIKGLHIKRQIDYQNDMKRIYIEGDFITDNEDYLFEICMESTRVAMSQLSLELETRMQEAIEQLNIKLGEKGIREGNFVTHVNAFSMQVFIIKKQHFALFGKEVLGSNRALFDRAEIAKDPSRINEIVDRTMAAYYQPYVRLYVHVKTADVLTVATVASLCLYCKDEGPSLSLVYEDKDHTFIQEIE